MAPRGAIFLPVKGRTAFPNSKAHPAGSRATTQAMHLVLASTTMRSKRHESAMSIVMGSIWLTNIVNKAASRHRRQANKKDSTLLFRQRFDFCEKLGY